MCDYSTEKTNYNKYALNMRLDIDKWLPDVTQDGAEGWRHGDSLRCFVPVCVVFIR